jgi:hypothetical protein
MKKRIFLCLLILITLATTGCKSNELAVESILDASSLKGGSVSLYNVKDKAGKVIQVITNNVFEETAEMYFVQEYTSTDSQELVRVKMAPKTLNLNNSEIVNVIKPGTDQVMPNQTVLSSVERSGQTFFLTSTTKVKPEKSKIFFDALVMEQEIMVYMLNCFPFESRDTASIHFINTRTLKEGDEIVRVEGKEMRTYNKQTISCYKVSLPTLGATAWYMEEKPHTLVEAIFSSKTILLADWNGI